MDCVKIGNLIAKLRKEKKLTQRNIADALGIQNKTVSKWECGLGCPDLSLWPELSTILGVDMKQMMEGEITSKSWIAEILIKYVFTSVLPVEIFW